MRDLERKVNKFIEKQASSSAKKARGTSPMISSLLSPTSTGSGFHSNAPTSTKVVKKINNRTLSMTVVFHPQVAPQTNPRFENTKSKDITIYHQDTKQKNVAMNPVDFAKSPRRNPILQDGQEPCFEFKAPYKATPLSNKMTFFDEEAPVKKRADGECKNIDNTRSTSPPAPCIRTFSRVSREDMSPDVPRRIRKGPVQSLKNLLNPITDGDLDSLKFRRVRKGAEETGPSEETKKHNDRKQLLSTDIGYCPKGRVYRDSSLAGYAQPMEEVAPVKGRRHGSIEYRKPEEMQGLLQYNYSGTFRQENVSPKCTAASFSGLVKGLSTSQMF